MKTHESREAFACALVNFLNQDLPLLHPKFAGRAPVGRETSLFEEGGIDSLGIVQIVCFVEAALGAELPLQDVHMRNFRTVDEIASLFARRASL